MKSFGGDHRLPVYHVVIRNASISLPLLLNHLAVAQASQCTLMTVLILHFCLPFLVPSLLFKMFPCPAGGDMPSVYVRQGSH